MIRNILISCLFCAFLSGIAFCEGETEINSQVVSVNPDRDYIVIKAGEIDGVEIGDGLIVHREGEKLGEAQVIEVRPEVSAAEILNSEGEIREGDSILLVKISKKAKKPQAVKEKTVREGPKKSKWATLMGSSAGISSAVPVQTVSPDSRARVESLKPANIQALQGGSIIRAEIDIAPATVFSYAMMVLRENGYIVTFSSRVAGAILAEKAIELTLMKELWADATARIEHKLVVSVEIKNIDGSSELNVSGFREHTQKNRQVKFPVANESKYYRDLVYLASKIKERSSGL
jgi:hypothetical protein